MGPPGPLAVTAAAGFSRGDGPIHGGKYRHGPPSIGRSRLGELGSRRPDGAGSWYMEDMSLRTTVILSDDEERALREAGRREGVSQSELIRRGIRLVTAGARARKKPTVGWLRLTNEDRAAIEQDAFGDDDA